MKRVVLSLVMFASVLAVSAQPRAIGGRVNWGIDISYQHGFGEANMLQLDLGLPNFNGFSLTGVYDWIFPISGWKEAGSWNWYAGVGGGLGMYGYEKSSTFFVGVAGMIGIEYNFKFPLQLSLDLRPVIGPSFGRDAAGNRWTHFNDGGFLYGGFGLGIRYKF